MKTKLPHVSLLLFLATCVQAQTPAAPAVSTWKTYTVTGEQFAVSLPILPAVDVRERIVQTLKVKRREVMIGAYADGVVYTIYVVGNPKSRQSLEDFIRGQKSAYGLVLSDESTLTRGGLSGKQFLLPDDSGMVQFLSGHERHYEFRAVAAAPDDARVKKFFDSVQFVAKPMDAIEAEVGPGLPFEPVVPQLTAADEASKKSFVGKEVERKIRLAMKPEPSYTESARQAGVAGTVVLKCIFGSNGTVREIRTVSGLPYGLTEEAIDAATKIKYLPAMKDGKFVSMWIQLEYNFNLY